AIGDRVLTENTINNLDEIIIIVVEAERAKRESDVKSERVKAAWHRKIENADKGIITKRCPAWLKENNGKWELDPERVAIIRDIFKLVIEKGLGQRAITKRLNAKGVKPFTTSKRGGLKWGWA